MSFFEEHRFFCIKCGNQAIPLARKRGSQHKKFHRKKLWCPYCKVTINCVECRNDVEVQEFKENFLKGEYKDEVAESLLVSRSSSVWENFMGNSTK